MSQTTTPLNQTFGVGRDISLVMITALGARIDLSGQINFHQRALAHIVNHEPLNSPPRRRYLPAGHDLTITLDRRGPANEELFSSIEAGYWAGGYPNGTQDGGTILLYNSEVDGSVTTWLGTNVALWMNDRMQTDQKSAIKQIVEGFASTWSQV